MPGLNYPIKLDDAYPCRGTDANGKDVHWDDLLEPGSLVGPTVEFENTPGEAAYVDGIVVEKDDGLWAVPHDA